MAASGWFLLRLRWDFPVNCGRGVGKLTNYRSQETLKPVAPNGVCVVLRCSLGDVVSRALK